MAIVTAAVALKVHGCGWSYYTEHSVRFHAYGNLAAFCRLPSLPHRPDKRNGLFVWREEFYDPEDPEGATPDDIARKRVESLWTESLAAERSGALSRARDHLTKFLEQTRRFRGDDWRAPDNLQHHRNSARDKVDAMTALDHGSSAERVGNYLRARSAFDQIIEPPPEASSFYGNKAAPAVDKQSLRQQVLAGLAACRGDRNLDDNVAYLEAAFYYMLDELIDARSFDEVVRRYPASEKREAALFMSAVASMKWSRSFTGDGGTDDKHGPVRDEAWENARTTFLRVMREYPDGAFYADASGWLAHLWLKIGNHSAALAEYYRMLASNNEAARAEAVSSLRFARPGATDEELSTLEAEIMDEPSTAMAYAYHEIYNFAVWHRCEPGGDDSWKDDCDKQRGNLELARIAAFATRMMYRYPGARTGAGFVLRVAEANLELGKDADAARLARRSLSMGVAGDQRAEALWVAGAAEHRLGRFGTARRALETLVAENRNNRFTEGGRRLLAMLLEDQGQLESALDQYLALDYRYDVAYFVDVLMPTERLAGFVRQRPSVANRDELLYALAIRYMRDRRWNEARETLALIKPVAPKGDDDYLYRPGRYDDGDDSNDDDEVLPKLMTTRPSIRGVRLAWKEQDLRTINDLSSLEQKYEQAAGEEDRAEALYQLASYQFEGNLQFYNAAAWGGIRHYLLYDLQQKGFRQPNESQVLFEYMQKHDQAANSLPIFMEVVRRFPNTRAARDALYTAAVCHDRLAGYNDYWGEIYERGGHAGPAMVTFADVRRVYAGYRLPRGTTGWEPTTRTVNGGPGWAPPPKKIQRPSRWERIKPYFDLIFGDIRYTTRSALETAWSLTVKGVVALFGWFYHLGCASLSALGLWFVALNAAENRHILGQHLSHCKRKPPECRSPRSPVIELGSFAVVTNPYLGLDLRDELLERGRDLIFMIRQLDRSGRTALRLTVTGYVLGGLLFLALIGNLFQL
jgi:outer membrane protein assembly factor BamD (BamD/ComL family)